MTAFVLLTGGTGTLGRLVLPLLRDAGCTIRVLSRNAHEPDDGVEYITGDLATGEGIESAVQGVDTIVHCAGGHTGDEHLARNLVQTLSKVGSPHVVNMSVVGAERVPVVSRLDRAMFGYFASKRAAELIVANSGLPWTTLRASQFHDLLLTAAQALAKLPVIPSDAGLRFQPIDTGDVATQLVELALGQPLGFAPGIAGPRVYSMKELIRSYLRAARKQRLTVPVKLPGKAARAVRAGAIVAPDSAVGRRTWEEFLAERVG
jgi:uncharacterized protein YbjT (DUF2867 family)